MADQEMPSISGSTYVSNTTIDLNKWQDFTAPDSFFRRVQVPAMGVISPTYVQTEEPVAAPNVQPLRVVKVFIVDPNENVPLDDRVIYKTDEMFTDLTDSELYFEINFKELLKAHNEKRVKLRNKAVKDREEMLEPARVRDLKMHVTTVAQF